ncbi:MAG: yugF [Bacillales bacterium]|jgi:pimeloyl-ACP methyl ester carboxylesterase|nr:yugF [Bacillales bacterium]
MENVLTGYHSIDQMKVYYEFYPNKMAEKTIILLHGFLASSFTFRHLIPLLHENYQVLSVDIPPFGKSGKSQGYKYSYKNFAKTTIQLIESLEIKKAIFIGHSMGGQVVLNILHQMPKLAEKAILLCSSSYRKRSGILFILSSYLPFFHRFLKFWMARIGVEKNLQSTLYNHSIINEEMINGYLQPFLEDKIFMALTRMIRHLEADLPAKVLKSIQTPCLLIWGDQDKSQPLHIGKRLHSDLVNSELVVLKETGHAVPEERPKEVFQHITHFLEFN